MDPGVGLWVHSTSEAEVPKLPQKLPPKPRMQLPEGFLQKPHVAHALKYMANDEQREKALEVAMAWKKKFAAKKWESVVATIEAVRKEDNVRSSHDNDSCCEEEDIQREHNDLQLQSAVNPAVFSSPDNIAERPRAMTAASAPAVPQVALTPTLTRHAAPRQHTSTISLPLRRILVPPTPRRLRWDVITLGPRTPLSPMPSANSFTNWLRPKPAPPEEQTPVPTPVTATYILPDSPTLLRDVETREVCNDIKKQIDALARRHCLARFKARSTGYSDFIPATMIKPKDTLLAASAMVESHRVKLKEFIDQDLPDRLQRCAATERKLRKRLRINVESELAEQNEWMNHVSIAAKSELSDAEEHVDDVSQPTVRAVSILDEQRAALRDLRKKRESKLAIRPEALAAAWAVKMLNDAECLARLEGEDSSSSSEDEDDHDEGYSYGNLLREIKSEMSKSPSSGTLAGMVDEVCNSDFRSTRSRSNTFQSTSSRSNDDFRLPQRSSMSPSKEIRWSERLSGSTVPNTTMHTSSLYLRSDLHVVTEAAEETPASELSPEDREFRHRRASFAELDHWAEELKKMEAMRAERQRSPTLHRRPPNRSGLSGSMEPYSPSRQMSVDSINARISPTRTMHSRFSSSSESSTSTCLLKPLPPPFTKHSPSASLSTLSSSKPTMLDHEYHKRKNSKTSAHKRDTSTTSMHDSVRRGQHLRSSSTVQRLAKQTSKEVEDGWMSELKRMESCERLRQAEERRKRTAELLRGDTLVGEEGLDEGR